MATLYHRDQYIKLLKRHDIHATLLEMQALAGGSSDAVHRLTVGYADGAQHCYVVRRYAARDAQANPRIAADAFALLHSLHAQGIPCPRPRFYENASADFSQPLLATDFVDGSVDFAPPDPISAAEQMAAALAAIHRVEPHAATESLPSVDDRVSNWLVLSEKRAIQDRVGGASILKSWCPQAERSPVALLHGDFWPGNMIWRNGTLVAVIDWEDAALGDPLADLAISRFDILFIYGRLAMEAFTRRYRSVTSIDAAQLPYWDLYAALRAAQGIDEWAASWPTFGRPDLTAERIWRWHSWFVAQAQAALGQK